MRGTENDSFDLGAEPDGDRSRRLTPPSGTAVPLLNPTSNVSNEANEDFLFHLYRGSELLQDDRADEAKEELERALQLQPHDTKGQDLLAVVYFRLGLFPRAISILEQLRRKNPKDTAILLNLSLCFLKTGQPLLARRELEVLLALNPNHNRAWGYLGLACERLGDLKEAELAFERGGHAPMARRMAERRELQGSMVPPAPAPDEANVLSERQVRKTVATAFEELDAGELSFELAPSSDSADHKDDASQNWRPIELGQMRHRTVPAPTLGRDDESERAGEARPMLMPFPNMGDGSSLNHRPTLIAPAAPNANAEAVANLRIPSLQAPAFVFDDAESPINRHAVVTVPPVRRDPLFSPPPAPVRVPTLPQSAPAATLPPPGAMAVAVFASSAVVMHASGIAMVKTSATSGYAARLEAIRATSSSLAMKLLDKQANGKTTGEPFGGAASPIVSAGNEGQLVLGPRPGRTIASFYLDDDVFFIREDMLLGFDLSLAYENGRLATGDGELLAVVQLRGRGTVLVEALGDTLTLDVFPSHGVNVRREAIVGWFGRLVPRALPPNEAPCGQRGLVSFAGEGKVIVATS